MYAATLENVNPLYDKISVLVEPRLDTAVSTTAWYLAAPERIPSIQYAYLNGMAGPEVISRVGFEVLGIQIRVTEHFGAGILDFRGLYKNPGNAPM